MNSKQLAFLLISSVLTIFGFATYTLLLEFPNDARLLTTPFGVSFITATVFIGLIGSFGLMGVITQEGGKLIKFFGEMLGKSF